MTRRTSVVVTMAIRERELSVIMNTDSYRDRPALFGATALSSPESLVSSKGQ